MTNRIADDYPLTLSERAALRIVAGAMIPASAEFDVPGADDDRIFADVLRTLVPSAPFVSAALQALGPLDQLDADAQRAACERFRSSGSPLVGLLVALIAQCYYRDERVMRSLDMEARPPFPKGFELEQGDWSLLDAVRARPKLYRDVR